MTKYKAITKYLTQVFLYFDESEKLKKICGDIKSVKFILKMLNISNFEKNSKKCIKINQLISRKLVKVKFKKSNKIITFYKEDNEQAIIQKFLRRFSVYIIDGLKEDFYNYFKQMDYISIRKIFFNWHNNNIIDLTHTEIEKNVKNLNKIIYLIIFKKYNPEDIDNELLSKTLFDFRNKYEIKKIDDFIFITKI